MNIKATERYELKYLLDYRQAEAVREALTPYLQPDTHGDPSGHYLITSLYYDTNAYKAYWEKMEGILFRRKVRVRSYNKLSVTDETACFLEIKQRHNKTVQKKRTQLPYHLATAFNRFDQWQQDIPESQHPVLQESFYLDQTLHLQPACVVSYDRLALNGAEYYPGLRVTFDTNLKFRTHDLTLRATTYAENKFFLPPDQCVMEIKANYNIPFWLVQILSQYRCTARRISKYCAALEKGKIMTRESLFLTDTGSINGFHDRS